MSLSLIFDLETTGLPLKRKSSYKCLKTYDTSRIVSIAWNLYDTQLKESISKNYYIIKPLNFEIPEVSTKIHGITTEKALEEGVLLPSVIDIIEQDIAKCDTIVAHNIYFDLNVFRSELYRMRKDELISETFKKSLFCTMLQSRKQGLVKRFTKLGDIYKLLFNEEIENCHDAYYDTQNCAKIYQRLLDLNTLRVE